MVQAMDIFMITQQDVTKPRENCNLKLPIVWQSGKFTYFYFSSNELQLPNSIICYNWLAL